MPLPQYAGLMPVHHGDSGDLIVAHQLLVNALGLDINHPVLLRLRNMIDYCHYIEAKSKASKAA